MSYSPSILIDQANFKHSSPVAAFNPPCPDLHFLRPIMAWRNDHSLLDLEDDASNVTVHPPTHNPQQYYTQGAAARDDPFSRTSISYDDFAGQPSTSSRPYPLSQSHSNISLGTVNTPGGASLYPQQSYFDDAYHDDDNVLLEGHRPRSKRSKRESGGGIGG